MTLLAYPVPASLHDSTLIDINDLVRKGFEGALAHLKFEGTLCNIITNL